MTWWLHGPRAHVTYVGYVGIFGVVYFCVGGRRPTSKLSYQAETPELPPPGSVQSCQRGDGRGWKRRAHL